MENVLIVIAIIGVTVYVVSSMMMVDYLKKRGEKINYIWIRLFLFSYADKYQKMTKEETGKIGPLFYVWITSINAALVCVILIAFVI
ncbi:MAG: hypothetical protein V2I46_10285 [Bacteroides sp.]|nr:hypothetical protein [Bacteroides sp.]